MSKKSGKEKEGDNDSGEVGDQARTEPDQIDEDQRLTVVGIGASAGGLSALQGFFTALPADTGMAFVVISHMDPERESLLPELLQRHTLMPVRQVQDLVPVEANHVYVIPPNRRIIITDTHLDLEEFVEPRGRRLPIDYFFRSLANVHRDAVAIVLSGGGTDGAVGVKDIKEQGGLLMVQHPDEAEHDSMPRAAISTGLADVVLPVAQLADKLVAYKRNGIRIPQDPEALTASELETFYRVLTQVQTRTSHDFSQYKRSTILRRIQRRMQIHGFATLEAYLTYLHHESDEPITLFNDLLIGVTNFFRDKEAWEALAETIIPLLFEKKQEERVRAWTIGCATGEEAYSLAMLLIEYVDRIERPLAAHPGIQVFASDLDDIALSKAREGLYPEAIEADVSPERLARFFVKEGNYYRVRREVRDVVLFSSHSVLRDPPFSRLDLISCRNMLIYLQRDLQQNVFQIFHYALNSEGYLFLGSSESAEMVHKLFSTLDKTHRVYQARPWRGEHPEVPNLPLMMTREDRPGTGLSPGQRQGLGGESRHSTLGFHLETLEEAAPPSVLVDETYHIVHTSHSAGRYLLHRGGAMTTDLLKLVRPELQFELRTALHEAFESHKHIVSHPILVQFNGAPHRVTVAVKPRPADNGGENETPSERLALVFFLEDEMTRKVTERVSRLTADGELNASRQEALIVQLEDEVQRLRERLQSTNEEYESSNEELKAANEELQSINEEYRSTTEELETSKEELQSVNEELQTVNTELKNKLEEISRAHSDLENLLASTEIATLFLDRKLRIQRYTPSTVELFNIMPGDRNRPISHLTHKLEYETLAEDAEKVLRSLVPIEHEVRDVAGRQLLARLRPYRTVNNRIDGVVLTFVDITTIRETERALEQSHERYRLMAEGTTEYAMLTMDESGRINSWNQGARRIFGYDETEVIDQPGDIIFIPEDQAAGVPTTELERARTLGEASDERWYRRKDDSRFWGSGVVTILRDGEQLRGYAKVMRDNTTRKAAEEALQKSEARYRELAKTLEERVRTRTVQVRQLASKLVTAEQAVRQRLAQTLHDDLQQIIYAIQVQLQLLPEEGKSEAEFEEMEEMVHHALALTRQLTMELSPPVLEGEGLDEAMTWLAKHMGELYQLQVTIEANDHVPVSEERRILLYQIVRELLFNVVKHAGVKAALLTLQDEGNGLIITVSDEGKGFDVSTLSGTGSPSFGLHHVQERLELFGGRADIDSQPGAGTRVTLFLPYSQFPDAEIAEESL